MSQSEFVILIIKKNSVYVVIDISGSMGNLNSDGKTTLETFTLEGITEILDSQIQVNPDSP